MSREKFTDLGGRIKYIRELNGIRKAQFAEKLGVSASYITLLESGKKTEISKALIKLISLVFRINETWILTGEGQLFRVGEGPQAPAHPPEVQKYIDKLVAILSGSDQRLAGKIEGFLDALSTQEHAGGNKEKKGA